MTPKNKHETKEVDSNAMLEIIYSLRGRCEKYEDDITFLRENPDNSHAKGSFKHGVRDLEEAIEFVSEARTDDSEVVDVELQSLKEELDSLKEELNSLE